MNAPPPIPSRPGRRAMKKTLWLCLLYLGLLAVMMIQADTSANLASRWKSSSSTRSSSATGAGRWGAGCRTRRTAKVV